MYTHVFISVYLLSQNRKMWLYPSSFFLLESKKNIALSSEMCTPLSYILLWKATEREMTPVLSVIFRKTELTWFKILNKRMPIRLVSPSTSAGWQKINVFFVSPHIWTTTELTRSCFGSFMLYIFLVATMVKHARTDASISRTEKTTS